MKQELILRFLSIFSTNFGFYREILRESPTYTSMTQVPNFKKYSHLYLCTLIAITLSACEDKLIDQSSDGSTVVEPLTPNKPPELLEAKQNHKKNILITSSHLEKPDLHLLHDHGLDAGITQDQDHKQTKRQQDLQQSKSGTPNTAQNATTSALQVDQQSVKAKKKKKKKNQKCRRGIHKGRKKCSIERGHISLYHINRSKRKRNLKLVDDKRRIIPEAREIMLDFLGDWREKTQCKKGFLFNYEYRGRASWRMYKCYVQDRLLWYLYLIGHHFDSEIHIVSGLRSKERKTSRHHNGHAVDFKVPGVSAKEVWEYCKRTFPLVGVGYYPKTRFIHLDVGRNDHQAYWVDSSGSGESSSYRQGVSQVQKGRAKKSQTSMIRSIKKSLKRHHKSFKARQKKYLDKQNKRAARAKRRKKNRRKRKNKN